MSTSNSKDGLSAMRVFMEKNLLGARYGSQTSLRICNSWSGSSSRLFRPWPSCERLLQVQHFLPFLALTWKWFSLLNDNTIAGCSERRQESPLQRARERMKDTVWNRGVKPSYYVDDKFAVAPVTLRQDPILFCGHAEIRLLGWSRSKRAGRLLGAHRHKKTPPRRSTLRECSDKRCI